MINRNDDTIAAICTGLTPSGINIIRISGNRAFEVADGIFQSVSKKKISDMKQFSVNYGYITDDCIIDEVLLLKMQSPHSYTKEDVIEIDCHGGIIVTRKILELILSKGVRLAEPGEFTKRAYLNGRIDLSQAEAVIDVINAKSELAAKNSVKQLKGNIKASIEELRDRIISKTAYIEAALDDPEHISLDGFDEQLAVELHRIKDILSNLISSANDGRLMNEGINTCILGLPNAGKSSLLNSLLNEERAIVTDIAGTTRDTLRETISLGDVVLNIIDTAGIRDTDNRIEQIGVERAIEAASGADLILYVIDSRLGISSEDKKILDSFKDKKVILLFNKSDLLSSSVLEVTASETVTHPGLSFSISSLTGQGIEELKIFIKKLFYTNFIYNDNDIVITNERHRQLLVKSCNSIDNAILSIESGMSEDFLTIDLMDAYESLGGITGESLEDDLADRIFSDFCMGK